MREREGFVEALLVAPIGVALLARLEAGARADLPWFELPADSEPGAVEAAADAVHRRSFGSLVGSAVFLVGGEVGPWISGASASVAAAYRQAEARRPIAEAIDQRFGDVLHSPFDPDTQEWWESDQPAEGHVVEPRFRSFDSVYGAGEFT